MPDYFFRTGTKHGGAAGPEIADKQDDWTSALVESVDDGRTVPGVEERASACWLPPGEAFPSHQRNLVATIVHNAVIYNVILAAGLAWAALTGESAYDVARVLLAGAAIAGLFGSVTMKSAPTAVQAALGILGLLII